MITKCYVKRYNIHSIITPTLANDSQLGNIIMYTMGYPNRKSGGGTRGTGGVPCSMKGTSKISHRFFSILKNISVVFYEK